MKDAYVTKDYLLASVLLTLGFNIKDLKKVSARQVEFEFEFNQDLKLAIKQFRDRSIRIEPNELHYNMKTLKNRIYDSVS